MEIVSTCALRVASSVWQPTPGRHALTIVCKATYLLAPGTSRLAPVQDEPLPSDVYWDDDEHGSLRSAGDLVPFKRRAEVIAVGHVHAPGRRPVTELALRLCVGDVDKTIVAFGDRWISHEDRVSDAAPFVALPLRWERASAGLENPVGMRLDGSADARGVALPSFVPHGFRVTGRRAAIPPVGLGPIAPGWPQRAGKLGARTADWDHRRWRERPFPVDVDGAYFNAAPGDQQLAQIRPDERLLLEHLHRDHPRLVTALEPLVPRVVVAGVAAPALALRCDTLVLDTNRGTVTLVWRGNMPLSRPDEPGQIIVSLDAGAAPAPEPRLATATMAPVEPNMALPFREGAPVIAPAPATAEDLGPAPPAGETEDVDLAVVGLTLPFGHRAVAEPSIEPAVPQAAPAAPPEDAAPRVFPAPPPMIGPLATPEMQDPGPAAPEAPTPEPEPTPAPDEPAEPSLPLAAYPIARCAAIAASIARRRDEQAAILDGEELDAETWAALEHHWHAAIREETSRGKQTLLRTHDEAYVGQLEKERGPITASDYARLSVAAERGTEKDALAALELPAAAMLRVQRVWLRKTALTPALGQAVREAVAAAREEA